MPLPTTRYTYPRTGETEANWDNFRLGLNTILRETELKKNELAQADNLILTGSGVPTRRWGSNNYFLAGATGSIRGLKGYYKTDGTNERGIS